jgi:rubredoxin
MWRCRDCGLIWDGESIPSECPKCSAKGEQFVQLDPRAAHQIEQARFTNGLLMQLYLLLEQVLDVAEDGIDEDLDRGCVTIFEEALLIAEPLQQAIKAEMAAHVSQHKWG